MKRKVAPIGLLAVMLAAVFMMWMLTPAPAAHANVLDGVGEWAVTEDPPSPGHGSAEDDDGGYEADPDTFQIDSWESAVIDVVDEPTRPARSRGLPGGGYFGWFLSWLLVAFGSRYYYWGSGS